MDNYIKYIETFFLGGSIITASKFISLVLPPQFAGYFAAFPISLVSSFFINDNKKHKFFIGTAIGGAIVSLIALSILAISHFYKNLPINYITIFGFIMWILLGITVVLFNKIK